MRVTVLTISTARAAGEAEDESGARLAELARRLGAESVDRDVVEDDRALIEDRLRHWADEEGSELILTTGGTGMAPTDVTPEATAAVIDRTAPGIAEAIRHASRPHTVLWMLSRGVAGTRRSTLIVNLPGSPASIDQTATVLEDALPHALALLRGERAGHGSHSHTPQP
jgi:molybdopterin adenylyltransferase